jgi:hypothetical protein
MRSFIAIATISAVVLTIGAAHANELIRVDMQSIGPSGGAGFPIEFTGVESQEAAANPVFGSNGRNTWNYLGVAGWPSYTTNPSFSNLVDSAGMSTNIGLSFSGVVYSSNDTPLDNIGSNGLENDYFLILGTQSVAYVISGLTPNAPYAFYLYAPNFTDHGSVGDPQPPPYNRGYSVTANGMTIEVPSGPMNNAWAIVAANGAGQIGGIWSMPDHNEGDWSGFQLAAVPEPSTWAMLLLGFVGLGYAGYRRARAGHATLAV